jgi:hypothetical protein
MEFWKPFSEIGITLLVALCAGIVTVGVVLPRDRAFLAERVGWAILLPGRCGQPCS